MACPGEFKMPKSDIFTFITPLKDLGESESAAEFKMVKTEVSTFVTSLKGHGKS